MSAITPLPTTFCKMIITMLKIRSMMTDLPLLSSIGMLTVKPTVVKKKIIKTVCSVSSKVMTAVPEKKRMVLQIAKHRPPTRGAGMQKRLNTGIFFVSTRPRAYMAAPSARAWYILSWISVMCGNLRRKIFLSGIARREVAGNARDRTSCSGNTMKGNRRGCA